MEKTYCVYKHTSPDGKSYVGMTKHGNRPEKRWQNGQKYAECPAFNEAILKYGWDSFSHDILANGLSKEEAEDFERYWIIRLESYSSEHGYNLDSGGNRGKRHSEETKRKIALSHLGIRPSEETKQKLREIALARPPMKQETKDKIGKANKGYKYSKEECLARSIRAKNRVWSEETKKKLSERAKGNSYRAKKVVCLETGATFDSAKEAAFSIKRSKSAVVSAISRNGICGGYHWQYI